MTAATPDSRRFASRRGLEGEIIDRSPRMPAPTPDLDAVTARLLSSAKHPWLIAEPSDLHTVVTALAAVTAERDQARQMLADVWDEGVSFGWHSTELRTDENPYRKAGL